MTLKLLRGQVVVREEYDADYTQYKHIIVPQLQGDSDDRHAIARRRTWHRGEVLSVGAPARTKKGVEVPHGFEVGDTVFFHWEKNELNFTRPWTDGKLACWLMQKEIDAVLE